MALVAGCVNAVGLLSFEHQAVSHLSGTATLLGADLMQGNSLDAFHLFGVLLSFLVGSGIAGFLLHSSALKLGRHYDTALLIEAGLLLGALWLLFNGSGYGHFLASAACGLQNALATTYSGAIVRTTHVTGIFTDLGIMFGRVLRGETLDKRKAKLFGLIILGFILGGLAGAWLFAKLSFAALYVPSAICILLALTYRVYSHRSAT
nr:YoaK family protein [Pseudoalteromonas sp. L21]